MNVTEQERYSIQSHDSVMAVRLFKTWNSDQTRQFCEICNQHISLCSDSRWAMIADISHWTIGTHDAREHFHAHHKQCLKLGLSHQVIIMPRSELKRWWIKTFLSSDVGVKTYFADDELSAVNWLQSKGFDFHGFKFKKH